MSNLDLDNLLTALSDDAPCGDDLEYDPAFTALETAALGKPELQMGDTIKEAEPPNWSAVRKDAISLFARTHDLRIALILSEASMQLDGLPGFFDALRLFEGLLEQFWETVHPRLDPDDDNDPTERINILNGLCDFDRIIRPLNRIPLVQSRALGGFGLRDIQLASGRLSAPDEGEVPSLSEIEAVFRDSDPEELKLTLESVEGCLVELEKIEQAFSTRLGAQDSPDFTDLLSVMKEIKVVMSQHAGVDTEVDADVEAGESAGDATIRAGAAAHGTGAIQSPQDVARMLDRICDYYRKHEPSSPIPILLTRAKNLVSKDFMEIMKDLAPDGVSQVEMFRGTENEEGN